MMSILLSTTVVTFVLVQLLASATDTTATVVRTDKLSKSTKQALNFDWTAAQAACRQSGRGVRVIEMAVEYDSAYCAKYGNGNAAAAEQVIKDSVRDATFPFMTQFCLRIDVGRMVGHCNDPNDPFVGQNVNASLTVGFLQQRWNSLFSEIERDITFLFSGQDHPAAGAAFEGFVCNLPLAYGFVGSNGAILIAHEVGHTLGCPHLPSGVNGIMHGSGAIGDNPFQFTPPSANIINNLLSGSSSSCISQEGNPPVTTPSPRPSPAVPEGWTCRNAFYNTQDGCDCECGVIDPDCSTQNRPGLVFCENPSITDRTQYRCDLRTNTCVRSR